MRRTGKEASLWLVAAVVFLMMGMQAYAMDHAVQTLNKEGVGHYLADAKGMTLYWFKMDSPGKSACAGPCVDKWPVYSRESVKAGKGLSDGDFGSITREDGKKQTTFRGFPLYYWAGDKVQGDTNGHGVNKVWHVVDPTDFPPKM